MKRFRRWFIIAILIACSLACLAFLFVNVNRGIMLPQATAEPTLETVDLRGQDRRNLERAARRALAGIAVSSN